MVGIISATVAVAVTVMPYTDVLPITVTVSTDGMLEGAAYNPFESIDPRLLGLRDHVTHEGPPQLEYGVE
jgi:hypothetical protein